MKMKSANACKALLSAAALAMLLYPAQKAHATDPVGFTGTTLAQGRYQGIDVTNYFVPPNYAAHPSNVWMSFEKTTGASDLYVQSNAWDAGGSTGWHSHPGHSLIVVTQGTITDYEAADKNCTPHVYTAGQSFVDKGGPHAHIIRNETSSPAAAIAVQLIPAKQSRRIDVDDPGNCHFPN
jgi:quercetin dioxygenase-like cupin family protein